MAEYRKKILLIKNKKAGAIPSNYRPITCLCTTFKLMKAIIADAIQNHLYKYNLIPEEQKGNQDLKIEIERLWEKQATVVDKYNTQ